MPNFETQEGCQICEIIPQILPEHTIYDGQYWTANLRVDDHKLPGTSFITAKRHVPELDDLTLGEELEYIVIRNSLIKAIRGVFEPITFNISCLKNDAFKADPNNTPPSAAHVHYQVKPRYSARSIEFAGETFDDPMPGAYLGRLQPRKIKDPAVLVAISDAIRGNFTL